MTLSLQDYVWQQYIQASGRKTVPTTDDSFNRKFFEDVWGKPPPAKGAEAAATWAWSFRNNFRERRFSLADVSNFEAALLQKLQNAGSPNSPRDVLEKAVYDALQLLGVQYEKYEGQPQPEQAVFESDLQNLSQRMILSLESKNDKLAARPKPTPNFLVWLYHVLASDLSLRLSQPP